MGCATVNEEREMDSPLRPSMFAALDALRRRLLDVTNKNRLLNYRHTNKSCLQIIDELHPSFEQSGLQVPHHLIRWQGEAAGDVEVGCQLFHHGAKRLRRKRLVQKVRDFHLIPHDGQLRHGVR